jgi:hypothetical protein
MRMTAWLLRFIPAAALAASALAACALEPAPDDPSGPVAGEESTPPMGETTPVTSARYDVTVTTQPDGQGDLVYAVRGYRIPQRDAGTVVVTFPSGSELRHEYEVQGNLQLIRRGQDVFTAELARRSQDPFRDHVVAMALVVHRHYLWLKARADGEALYGIADEVAMARHMNVALHRDQSSAGYCGTDVRYLPIYGVTQETCEPERPPEPDVIATCYGAEKGQDFQCSAGLPQEAFWNGQRIDLRRCCLEHDRAFWCGGTGMGGAAPPGGVGSFPAWEAANDAVADCFVQAANEALRNAFGDAGPVDEEGAEGGFGFLEVVGRGIWDLANTGMFPEAGEGFFNLEPRDGESDEAFAMRQEQRARLIAERQSSCLCGGDRAVPLCGTRCNINDCSLPAPQVLERSAFVWTSTEDCPGGECLWVCEEKTLDGEPISRRLRTHWINHENGAGHFDSCTPEYDFTCECDEMHITQALHVCEVGFADLDHHVHDISLPGEVGLIPLPPDARFAPPPIRKPPYITP